MRPFRPGDHPILVIEPREEMRSWLLQVLRLEGYRCSGAARVSEGLAAARVAPPAGIVLGPALPDRSGLTLCRQLRRDKRLARTALILVSGEGDPDARIAGLEAGADDCVSRPLNARELALRMRARIRERGTQRSGAEAAATTRHIGEIELDLASYRCLVSGKRVSLSLLEFRLLARLMEQSGQVQTRETLYRHFWSRDARPKSRTLDSHIKRLRQKLGPAGSRIRTVRGLGYQLD